MGWVTQPQSQRRYMANDGRPPQMMPRKARMVFHIYTHPIIRQPALKAGGFYSIFIRQQIIIQRKGSQHPLVRSFHKFIGQFHIRVNILVWQGA